MPECDVFIGTYANYVAYGEFNSETGELRITGRSPEIEKPSYICLSEDRQTLYAVSEVQEGMVFSIDLRSNQITGRQKTNGAEPCHLCVLRDTLFVGNYAAGSLSVFALDSCGRPSESNVSIAHYGRSVDTRKQDRPHVHCVTPFMDGVAVCDAGLDRIMLYPRHVFGKAALICPPGSAPRHCVALDDCLYANTEMGNTVLVFYKDRLIQEIATLPEDYASRSLTAAIKLSPDRKHLIVSNRRHNSLAYYRIGEDKKLSPIGIFTATEHPRDFAYSPDGTWILCGGQRNNALRTYKINDTSISEARGYAAVPSPVCILCKAR